MRELIYKNWHKNRYIITFFFIIVFTLLLTVVYKSDDKIIKKSEIIKNSIEDNLDLKRFKKFVLNQIISPFINVNYKIKKGDTIQKILKKYNIKNNDIQIVINEYKKFGKSNQLLVGKK